MCLRILCILITSVLLSNVSYAGGYFKLAGLYLSRSSEEGGSTSKSVRTLTDFSGGYTDSKGWAFGLHYATDKNDSDGVEENRTSYGATGGWITRREMGPFVLAHYFISSKYGEAYSGSGYQLDLGYKYLIRKLFVALQISYKSFTYDKFNGDSLSSPKKDTLIDPYFAILLDF